VLRKSCDLLGEMTSQLLTKSRPWTVAALASARPQGKVESDLFQSQESLPRTSLEAQQLLNMMKREAISRVFMSGCPGVLVEQDTCTVEQMMGSFTSTSRVDRVEDQDEDLTFRTTTAEELLDRCKEQLEGFPETFDRHFVETFPQHTSEQNKNHASDDTTTRIFQWNLLSQSIGTQTDKFVRCDPAALDWNIRRWRILEEIIQYTPDIITLQEVDHFKLIKKALNSIGYHGRFTPKPDSPCIYLESNNGPDGCAIFYNKRKFELISKSSKVLDVWGVASNQVVLSLNLKHKETEKEVCVATTHLKARSGALLATLRNEQVKDILEWLNATCEDRPIILSGDFNAEPSEPLYKTVTENSKTPLQSAYTIKVDELDEEENLDYTTWKIRETGEQKHVLDYIFHSPQLQTVSTLEMPTEEQIGEDRLPSVQFASDHLSLVVDIKL